MCLAVPAEIIEIKDGADVVPKTLALVKQQKMLSQTIIFSFNADFIRQAKQIEPKVYTVWLNSEPKDLQAHFAKCKEIKADAIGVAYPAASREIVAEAHKRKMPVFVWTVPPGPEIDRLKGLKVNFIITNHPRDVIEQLKKS
jgi:glycerophosphoryl diester phosphodiesterase